MIFVIVYVRFYILSYWENLLYSNIFYKVTNGSKWTFCLLVELFLQNTYYIV